MNDNTAPVTAPGTRTDRYRLEGRIATGGMGEVWRATDTLLEREVAVKVLKREYSFDPLFRSRFESEARSAAALAHPNVASVLDFGELPEDDGSGRTRPFLVMELVPGEPLSALLRGGEPMPPETAADLTAQAADAIGAAHALGIVHRDVKPGNLLVTPGGTVKITDFGIARTTDGAALTQTGQLLGTPHYMSPEQAEGKPATPASDVYALGVVLYECLAGRRPFAGDTPVTTALAHLREPVPPLPEAVPAHLRAVVDRALAKDPADRFSTADEMAAALRGGPVAPAGAEGADGDADRTRVLTVPPVAAGVGGVVAGSHAAPGPGGAGSDRRARGGRLPAWWPWAGAALGVLLVVLLVSLAVGETSPSATEPATGEPTQAQSPEEQTATQQPEDDRVRVREAALLGMEHKEAKERLEGLGLEVEEEKVEASSPDHEKNTVAGVEPTGLLEPGSTVTLLVWEEYRPPDPDGDDSPGKSDEAKDNDKGGQGKGKGRGN